jgi:hypothetical protein
MTTHMDTRGNSVIFLCPNQWKVDVLLLVDKLLAAVAVCAIARLRFVRVRCSARVNLPISVSSGCAALPGWKSCLALPLRITVTPAGATSSLEACSWVEPLLPSVPGETLGPLVGPASGGASASYPSWRRCFGREGSVAFRRCGLAGFLRGWVVLCQLLQVWGSGTQCTPSSARYCRLPLFG